MPRAPAQDGSRYEARRAAVAPS